MKEMTGEGLSVAAQVAATIFAAVFAIAAIVFQINGYPLGLLIKKIRQDVELTQATSLFFASLFVQLVAFNAEKGEFWAFAILINPLLILIELAALVFLVHKLLAYLELVPLAEKLGDEIVEVDSAP
jgi:hypothetical protein